MLKPFGTRAQYGPAVEQFCKKAAISPESFQQLSPLEARRVAWKYIRSLLAQRKQSTAIKVKAALSSFYENREENEPLVFKKKHVIPPTHLRLETERIPTREQVYQIIDATPNLRDKALMLLLFFTGMRINGALRLNYGDVREGLSKGPPLVLRVTGKLDSKLGLRNPKGYVTFLEGEGFDALRRYCDKVHGSSSDETALFLSAYGQRLQKGNVWQIFVRSIVRAGYKKHQFFVHSLRKAHRKCLRHSGLDEQVQEFFAGHNLGSTKSAYFDADDIPFLRESYGKIPLSRTSPKSAEFEETKQTASLALSALASRDAEIRELRQNLGDLEKRFTTLTAHTEKLSIALIQNNLKGAPLTSTDAIE
jgi:integrase